MKSFIILLFLPFIAFAQQDGATSKKACSCRFSSINQIGLQEGNKGAYAQFQTINGVQYNKWFAGIGVGIDHYAYRSVPLFIDVRRFFLQKKGQFFVYADGGTNLPWVTNKTNGYANNSFAGGLYLDGGLGYEWLLKKQHALQFSAGFGLKKMSEDVNYDVSCITFPCPQYYEKFNYTLRTLTVKAGWRF